MSPRATPLSVDTSTVDNYVALAPPVDYDQKKAFAAVAAICLVLGGAAILMRILTSRRSGEKTVARNWTFSVAMVFFVSFICASIAMFSFGDELNVMAYAGASVASATFYTGSLVFLRIAMLCLYQDMLFSKTRYWRISIALGSVISVYSLVFIIAESLQCKPNMPRLDIGRCINISDLEIVIGTFDFISLSIVLAMPVKGLWQGRKHPDSNNNICYPIAFALGFIACILSLVHAVAPAAALWTWSLLYPLSGLITLTLIIASFAVIDIPTFIRCHDGPIQSPTTTHPHLQSLNSRSASVVSWMAERVSPRTHSVERRGRGHARTDSADTFPSVTDVPTDLEKSTDALAESYKEPTASADASFADEKPAVELPEKINNCHNDGGRTSSMRSFTRLGSLTGAVKPPSFIANRTSSLTGSVKPPSFLANRSGRSRAEQAPQELDLSGITVKTEVEMSWEARRKALSRGQSRSSSPARGRKPEG